MDHSLDKHKIYTETSNVQIRSTKNYEEYCRCNPKPVQANADAFIRQG